MFWLISPSGPLMVTMPWPSLASTPAGNSIGFLPTLDITLLPPRPPSPPSRDDYHTWQITSPPTLSFFACLPVWIPFGVDRMATPSPAITRGMLSLATYVLRPGLLILLMPWMVGDSSSVYLRYTRIMPCLRSFTSLTFFTYPSSLRIFAISTLIFDDGMSTFSSFVLLAFLMRVSMSAIGSVIICLSPLRRSLLTSSPLSRRGSHP